MTKKIYEMRESLRNELDKARYEHTLGVMYMAAALAMRYGANMENALTAGLLHDCAKCIPASEKIRMCRDCHIEINDTEFQSPNLLHAKLGAYLAKARYQVNEREITDAIAAHTTGRPAMSLMDKILYIADYIEPGREEFPRIREIRRLAFTELDECLYYILEDTLVSLEKRKLPVDAATEETYLYYKKALHKESK